MTRSILTSFLDGFALAGLFTLLRRRGAPTRAFAPSRKKEKMVIVIDDDQAVEKLEGLRRAKPGLVGAGYDLVEAQVYIRDRCNVG
jgi:hypothetical protein